MRVKKNLMLKVEMADLLPLVEIVALQQVVEMFARANNSLE